MGMRAGQNRVVCECPVGSTPLFVSPRNIMLLHQETLRNIEKCSELSRVVMVDQERLKKKS